MMDTSNMIFVFGSNEAGVHGAGAARFAFINRGARWGNGVGIAGQSYAIPTKDKTVRRTLSLRTIKSYVDEFLMFSQLFSDIEFQVTRIGCGLASLKDSQIAPMFVHANKADYPNVWFDNVWMHEFAATGRMSLAGYNIWGTF